ncbi:MAG: TolC family outer membrane protein [Pseudomonadales bacterium]
MKAVSTYLRGIIVPLCLLSLAISPAVSGSDKGTSARDNPATTLAGIYELALEDDLTLQQARAEYRIGREERRLGRAGLLPQINASYSMSDADAESSGFFPIGGEKVPNQTERDTDTDRWQISLEQPLFDLGAWFQFQRGQELSNQARATLSVAQQDLLLRVVNAYFDVLRATANLRASKAQESALEGQLDQVRQRFEVGLVAITEVHEAEAGYDLAVAQRISDEGELDVSRERLSVLTGRHHGQLWELKDDFPVRRPDPETPQGWVEFARQNNLDIKVAQYGRGAAQEAMQAARSQHLPRVNLSLTRSDSESDIIQRDLINRTRADFPSDQSQDVIAINVTMPLFSGGRTSAQRRQAVARHETQTAFYQGTIRQVTQETRASYTRVASDVSRSRARARAVTSAESALEAAELGYEVGTRNVVDVLNAQQAYFSAVRDYDNSILDYVVSLTRLKRLAGTLSPQDIYELNEWLEAPREDEEDEQE